MGVNYIELSNKTGLSIQELKVFKSISEEGLISKIECNCPHCKMICRHILFYSSEKFEDLIIKTCKHFNIYPSMKNIDVDFRIEFWTNFRDYFIRLHDSIRHEFLCQFNTH